MRPVRFDQLEGCGASATGAGRTIALSLRLSTEALAKVEGGHLIEPIWQSQGKMFLTGFTGFFCTLNFYETFN
jgi:hypothetical protein